MSDGGAYVTAGIGNAPTPGERVRVDDAGAYITAGIQPPQPNYARPATQVASADTHSEKVTIAKAVKAQKAAKAKAVKAKPSKAQVKKPAGLGVPSSPSPAPSSGGVGPSAKAPSNPTGTTGTGLPDPLVLLGAGLVVFLVIVMLSKKRR